MPRILLVEDDEGVRPLLEHTLISAGHDVDTAGTMESGIIMLEHRAYDLVIADAKLPDGTGMAVIDQALAKDIRGLIITGYAFTLPADAMQKYEVLLKPLRPAEIVAAADCGRRQVSRR
jgi:DNA-binding response OmpR family regulator